MAEHRVIVMGAGLAGTMIACFLARRGSSVHVYEKRPDPRIGGAEGGRSINLALSTRGIHALDRLGIANEVLTAAIPMRGRLMHAVDGRLSFQRYGTEAHQVIHSVSRSGLNAVLLDAAEAHDDVRFTFGRKCVGVDLDTASVTLAASDDTTKASSRPAGQVATGDLLVGADGAYSAVRLAMQMRDRFDYRQDYLTHGYKELSIPPADDGSFRLEPGALHIWPRGGFMMIALPNADRSFTCTLFARLEGENGFSAIRSDDDVERYFDRWFLDAVPHMPTLLEDFRTNPTSSLVTVRCGPWHHEDRVVLVGDAAHAVVPFYGQGMNASFEDCAVLDECIEAAAPDWSGVLASFYGARKENTDALAELAVANFIEMRDRVTSPVFLLSKALGRGLHRVLPRWFVPIYTMVTFTRMPYAEAVRRSRRQRRVVTMAVGASVALLLVVVVFALL